MIFLAILLALAMACGNSREDQVRELRENRQSWEATARLTTELWQKGKVPAKYARQALDVANQELEKIRRKAEKLSQ